MRNRKFTSSRVHADSDKTVVAFFVVWAAWALLGLAFWGIVAWAIIKLVSWAVA